MDNSGAGGVVAGIGTILGFGLLAGLYFVPSIVGFARRRQSAMVFVLNLFLGWTLIGWVVALAIAVSAPGTTARPPITAPDGQRYFWDGRAWQKFPLN